ERPTERSQRLEVRITFDFVPSQETFHLKIMKEDRLGEVAWCIAPSDSERNGLAMSVGIRFH
ncbi:MAG: hypothetical protein R3231_10220, partial [bacterium]|nr:hypothetical protein [bacterium]